MTVPAARFGDGPIRTGDTAALSEASSTMPWQEAKRMIGAIILSPARFGLAQELRR